MIAVDSNMLLLFLSPVASPPLDRSTGKPITFAHERVGGLVKDVSDRRSRVLIPTPVLSECLVRAGTARAAYLQIIRDYAVFRIAPFDVRAAIELAVMTEKAIAAGDKKGGSDTPWAKVKFDRQIVSICKVEGAHTIYTDDPGVRRFAEESGVIAISLADCPLPKQPGQGDLPLRPGDHQA